MLLWYLFWDNFKKTWYSQWKLVKPLYESQVVNWKKSPSSFIKEQTESVMETERAKTEAQIDICKQEVRNSEKNVQSIQNSIDAEKKKIKESYAEKIDALNNEKNRIESCFSTYSTWLAEKAKSTEDLFSKLTESLWKYAEETKWYIWKQSVKTKDYLDEILWNTKNFLLDDVKRDFLAYKAKDNDEKKVSAGKSRLYTIILILLCSFDIVAWFLSLEKVNMWRSWLNLFIAILMVAIGMVLVYFSWREKERQWGNKQIWLLCVIIVIFIFAIYTALALEIDTISKIINLINAKQFKYIFSVFLEDPNLTFFILRLLILPALFVWDVLIKMIDVDALFSSIHLGNRASKLMNKCAFFFKKKAFAKSVEEEKTHYWEILKSFEEISIPWFEEVLLQIEKLESKIMPISNELIEKRNECEAKIVDINEKIHNLLEEETVQLENVDKSYVDLIEKEEKIIKSNTYKINLLSEQLWNAEISVRQWIGLWLIS